MTSCAVNRLVPKHRSRRELPDLASIAANHWQSQLYHHQRLRQASSGKAVALPRRAPFEPPALAAPTIGGPAGSLRGPLLSEQRRQAARSRMTQRKAWRRSLRSEAGNQLVFGPSADRTAKTKRQRPSPQWSLSGAEVEGPKWSRGHPIRPPKATRSRRRTCTSSVWRRTPGKRRSIIILGGSDGWRDATASAAVCGGMGFTVHREPMLPGEEFQSFCRPRAPEVKRRSAISLRPRR